MILNPPVPLSGLEFDLLLRLGMATLLGLFLGIDRELRGHAAGLRTHGLICLAAATLTISMLSLYTSMPMENGDPLRLFEAAGAFVGIVGAGLIVFNKGEVQNLTTAVHLFLTTVIGVACGAAQWPLVATAAPIGLVVLSLLSIIEQRVARPVTAKGDDATET
jgi:putative Mg2+ transporter-C (MgtC) family protein